MSEKIIKDPLREFRRKMDLQKAKNYQPEYVRLGIEPVEGGKFPATDFKSKKSNIKVNNFPNTPLNKLNTERVLVKGDTELPVHSGNNYEHTWYGDSREEEYVNGDIKYDEIPSPPTKSVKEESNLNLSEIEDFNYFLTIEGNIVHVSDSLNDIEQAIEFILYDPKSPFDVDARALRVFKALSLKVGVLISE